MNEVVFDNFYNNIAERCKGHDRIFLLTDPNILKLVAQEQLPNNRCITIPQGEEAKSIDYLQYIWQQLIEGNATRNSIIINLGGGSVSDIGGLAAATFKRGIAFINAPTTLLAMVDASVGGKTAIDFNGIKNEIGVFAEPQSTIIDCYWLNSLPERQLFSGYAEMIKHALLTNVEILNKTLEFINNEQQVSELSPLIQCNIEIKRQFVETDKYDVGIRKALNLGHTIGHAFEAYWSNINPILHGEAIMWGMVGTLYLSHILKGFPLDVVRQLTYFAKEQYTRPNISCNDYNTLIKLMSHDKKNDNDNINFVLLSDIGKFAIQQSVTTEHIKEAMDFIRES